MARKTKPAIPKIGQQLSYWQGYAIFDAAKATRLIDFTSNIPHEISVSIDYLAGAIRKFPGESLGNPTIWGLVAFVRESELNGSLPRGTFDKILKATRIEYRGFHKRSKPEDLQRIVFGNLMFFLKILNRDRSTTIDSAITKYINEAETTTGKGYATNKEGEENYKRIFTAYNKVYKNLTAALSQKEAIHFLEHAGKMIGQPIDYSIWKPEKRRLLYAKGMEMVCEIVR
ncbi:MAG: hypothetical protein WBV23_03765 [Desulfobaccales bacterium]